MADSDSGISPTRSQSKVAPFDPARHSPALPPLDVTPFTPKAGKPERPAPAQGIDLSDRPKILFAAGRGKTGKTTLLRWIAEEASHAERSFLMADIDPSNASFSSYFASVSRPQTDDPAGVTRWLQQFIDYAVAEQVTALIDLGGGDTTLRSIAGEMPGFADQIAAAGSAPVLLYLTGTQPDDLVPLATLADRGFRPAARALVLNESSAEPGFSREEAFGPIVLNRAARDQIAQGALTLWMPRLHAASAVELRRCSFTAARDGQTEPPLGLFDRARVRAWLDAMTYEFQGIRSWMP